MAYNKITHYGESQNILESEVGLVTKTVQATNAGIQADADGRKVIKAGDLFTSDALTGVYLADVDMTDYAKKPVAVVVAGRVRADRVTAAVTAKKADLKGQGLYLI